MKTYTVADRVASVNGGVVRLTPEQAKVRLHKLKALAGADGHYEVLGELQFKRGESFGWDGEFPKAYRATVEVTPDPQPPAPVTEPEQKPEPEAVDAPKPSQGRKGRKKAEAGAGAG